MSKILITLILGTLLVGCADQNNRQRYLEKTYPKCKVEPATGLIQNSGYDFIIIDSTNQIIAVDFYLFSESKISNLRNIR
jgi:hypothetical protein